MRAAPLCLIPLLLVGAGAACDSPPPAPASSPPAPAGPVVHKLLQVTLAEQLAAGREVLVDVVEIPPSAALERHWHPGEEFHYYLEGQVSIELDGAPTIEGTPGTVGHVPYARRHRAVAGADGARILVFRVHTQGEPWRYVD